MFKIGGGGDEGGAAQQFHICLCEIFVCLLTLFRSFSGHQREYITKIKEFSTKRPLKNG